MSQLEELKRQRNELDAKIKEIEAGQQTIQSGDFVLRFYNKNYPQMSEQITLSIKCYGAGEEFSRSYTVFYTKEKDHVADKIKSLISDLQSVLSKIE